MDDAPHVGQKAHVKHAVGLVEHQHFHLAQVDRALADVIEKPTRTGNHDLGAGPQSLQLRPHAYPAVDRDTAQGCLAAQVYERLVDLLGQLARGRHDQRADAAPGSLLQAMQDREGKRGGLARAGLRQTHHVASRHDRGNGLFLNGSRFLVTERVYTRGQPRAQVECCKSH